MTATILDGAKTADGILEQVKAEVDTLRGRTGAVPTLATVLVGDDPASHVYVKRKVDACGKIGMGSRHVPLPAAASAGAVRDVLKGLNDDPGVHGVLLQLPLPKGLPSEELLELIRPEKDVDGFHPYNLGRLLAGRPDLVPCTPAGVMALLDAYQVALEGKTAVVVGRSVIVGKPVAQLLLARNATVVCTHSKTRDLPAVCRQADVLVAAVGRAGLITADYVAEGAVVVDVGINSVEDEAEIVRIAGPDSPQHRSFRKKGRALAGDVEWRSVVERAGAVSPVPGGVGPLTIALLMRNTLRACKRSLGVD